jgi:hypothetical protein
LLDEKIRLKGYDGDLCQVSVTALGHEEPTLILTNDFLIRCPTLVWRYAHRMMIENGISDAIQFFYLDALSFMVGLKIDFDLQSSAYSFINGSRPRRCCHGTSGASSAVVSCPVPA